MLTTLSCSYASVCGGCDLLLKPYDFHQDLKRRELVDAWNAAVPVALPVSPEWISIASGGLRDRVDLMIDQKTGVYKLGLFDKFRTGIVDLQGCPQMSPGLEEWYKEFRRIQIPVQRGSVRLRVSPSGLKGVWLDLANVDVKMLLDQRECLDRLRSVAVVEIGQKRKRLVERDGVLKLADAQLEPWFETYADSKPFPLYCAIGSFTQPGFKANRALTGKVHELVSERVKKAGAKVAMEFGAGIGNFTFPLASVFEKTIVYEVDGLALEGLKRTALETGLSDRIVINEGNYQIARKEPVEFRGVDLVLVDPPRSGLQKFLDPVAALAPAERPPHLIYVSCFAESFAQDSARLLELGYTLSDIAIVDQFPQSRHFEIVAAFDRVGCQNN